MYRLSLIIFIALTTVANAQQQQSTAIDRITFSLANCVKVNEEGIDKINQLQNQLSQALAEIKKLKEGEKK